MGRHIWTETISYKLKITLRLINQLLHLLFWKQMKIYPRWTYTFFLGSTSECSLVMFGYLTQFLTIIPLTLRWISNVSLYHTNKWRGTFENIKKESHFVPLLAPLPMQKIKMKEFSMFLIPLLVFPPNLTHFGTFTKKQ